MFFNEVFMDKDFEESHSARYDKIIDMASRGFTDDSVDENRKRELYLILACAYEQLDDTK